MIFGTPGCIQRFAKVERVAIDCMLFAAVLNDFAPVEIAVIATRKFMRINKFAVKAEILILRLYTSSMTTLLHLGGWIPLGISTVPLPLHRTFICCMMKPSSDVAIHSVPSARSSM